MGRGLIITLAVAATALAVVIARTPLAAVAGWADLGAGGLSYVRAEGTVWDGRLVGARLNGHELGVVEVSARASALFTGALGLQFSVNGDGIIGAGSATVGIDRTMALKDTRLSVDLQRFSYFFEELPFIGRVDADVSRIVFGPRGCRAAEAEITTDALAETAAAMRGAAPVLAGDIRCDGDALVVALAGAENDDAVDLALRLQPDLTYALDIEVHTAERGLSTLLPMLGFDGSGEAFTYSREGALAAAQGGNS